MIPEQSAQQTLRDNKSTLMMYIYIPDGVMEMYCKTVYSLEITCTDSLLIIVSPHLARPTTTPSTQS